MSVFCLHRFALSTNPRIIPAEISRYRLLSMSVSLISRQPMKLQISFGFARAMPTTNPQTGMLWERDPDCKVCYARRRSSPRTFGCVRGKYIGYIMSAQYFAKNSICRVEKHTKFKILETMRY